MTRAIWSPEALTAFDDYIRWIAERDVQAARQIREEIVLWAERLAAQPGMGQPSLQWPQCRKHSRPNRGKFVLYRERSDGIQIVAFRDARQNNADFRPPID